MFKHWQKLFHTDCSVLVVGEHTVYPIYRVASTSLRLSAERTYTNADISKCRHIEIIIRDPKERFVSGLNEYCRQHALDVKHTRQRMGSETILDRHFAPQYFWLLNLYRFYKGHVTLRPFEYLRQVTNLHVLKDKVNIKKIEVDPLLSFVQVDYCLLERINQKVKLGKLIKDCKHVLS